MNIEILNWLGPSWEGEEEGVKRTGRDEPVGVVIHTCSETNRKLLVQLSLSQTSKKSCLFIFYFCFFFYKIREKEGGTDCGCWHEWEGWRVGKGVNNVYTCM
jgi:hypothetical protein